MFANDLTIKDIERIGPIIEGLLHSGKLNDEEKWAVDLSCRAATDLAQIRHSEIARAFYARPDIQEQSAKSISDWLAKNPNATPGTVTAICGRMHVASYGADGTLKLYPALDL